MKRRLARLEERRGESTDLTMKRAGQEIVSDFNNKMGYFTQDEARVAAARRCDELGVDPSWPLPDRVSRMIDIEHGSGRMAEEVVRGADYSKNKAKTTSK